MYRFVIKTKQKWLFLITTDHLVNFITDKMYSQQTVTGYMWNLHNEINTYLNMNTILQEPVLFSMQTNSRTVVQHVATLRMYTFIVYI